MPNNDSYVAAKNSRNNEFYTQYEDIQREINAYVEFDKDVFRNKTILCPCDDPEWSNFTRFFAQNFEILGLRKLISTSYATDSKRRFYGENYQFKLSDYSGDLKYQEEIDSARGKIFVLDRDNHDGDLDINNLQWNYLRGDGDFSSKEVTALRDEADMVITNPPFTLLVDFVNWIFEGNNKFIVIGNIGSIMYRDMFNLIKDGKMWLGNGFQGGNAYFRVPEGNQEKKYANGVYDEKTGLVKFRNCCWLTNVDHGKRHQPLKLMTMEDNIRYSKHKEIKGIGYIKYDNYDAIEVNYADAIPSDYNGVMGVSSSFLEKYCPEQFEIIGATQTGCHPDSMVTNTYKDYVGYHQDGTKTGRHGNTCGHNPMIERNDGKHDYYMNKDGKIVQSANGRVLIRRKQ